MKRMFFIICICLISRNANALSLDLEPHTWYEINSTQGATLLVAPDTMQVGIAHYQARAFWEYSVSAITSQFESINSAFVTINSIGWTHTIQLATYQADGNPTIDDWWNVHNSDTWQNGVLYGWDDLFQRGPSNVFNVSAGLVAAVANNYTFFGLGFWAPSASGTPNTFSEVEADAQLTITGAALPQPVPEPSTLLLIGTGLVWLAGFRRKLTK